MIAEPRRRPSGYRQHPPEVVRRVWFIRHAKELGFSLKEFSDLLSLRVDPSRACGDARERAHAKIADIEDKIKSLERIRMALQQLVKKCRGKGPVSQCPILEVLDRDMEVGCANG